MAASRRRRSRDNQQRYYVFAYQLAWLGLIAAVGWLVATDQPVFGYLIPERLKIIPSAVPWYGALGGVMISLVGVHEHRYDWDPRYWTWYVARPFVGAFVAIIAVLIFQSGILAVGLDPSSDKASAVPQDLFYYVLAFLTGYREDSFRHLIKRVADVLLTSKDASTPPLITGVEPATASSGDTVAVQGAGFTGTQVVRIGGVEADFKLGSDAQLDVVVPVLDAAGPADITVINANTNITQPNLFTYAAPVDPVAGPEGDPPQP